MISRPGKRATLFLAGLTFLPELGGRFPPQTFIYNAAVRHSPSIQATVGDSLYCRSLRYPPAQNWQLPGTQPRQHRLCRLRALAATGDIFGSVARTPVPPGYEGGKQQRKDDGDDSEFNLNVGKVIDTLSSDYPRMFEEPLDFEIYTADLQLRDPSGVVLNGLAAYQRLFATMRFFHQIMINDVSTVFRLSYDGSRQQVRVCWHFVLDCTPVVARPLHVDGMSIYSLSVKGLVRRHDIETVIVNGTPAKPPFVQAWINIPSWVSRGLVGRGATAGLGSSSGATLRGIPPGVGAASVAVTTQSVTTLHRQRWARFAPWILAAAGWKGHTDTPFVRRILVETWLAILGRTRGWQWGIRRAGSEGFGRGGGYRERWVAAGGTEHSDEGPAPSAEGDKEGENVCKKSNSKDGEGDDEDKETPPKRSQKKKKGFWPIEIDGPLGCETSWDCTGGYVCCDLIVVKICCSNGVMQPKLGDHIPVLLPIPGRGRTELDQITVI